MDEKDVRILSAISELGSKSPERIREETGIPKSTVHYRIAKLRERGVIEDGLFSVDLSAVGVELTVITEVMAEYREEYHAAVGEELRRVEGVNKVFFMMGDTDFVVISRLTDRSMVEELVSSFESIEGVTRTSSKFVITTVDDPTNPISAYSEEALTELLAETE